MKKLILLAVAAAFILTGCDVLLEAVFPGQTAKAGSNNSFSLAIDVNPADHLAWSSTKAYVALYDWDTGAIYQTYWTWLAGASSDPYVYGSVSLNSLPDGDYYALVWYDTNGNGAYDTGEPAADVPGPTSSSYATLNSLNSIASYTVYFN